MAIKSMKLSWIVGSDLAKSKKFFVDTLGLKLVSDAPEHDWLELQGEEGGMFLGVGKNQPEEEDNIAESGMNAVVTMTVDNLVETKKELEAKGVIFIDEIMEVPGHVKMVSFTDPDENIFQLVEELD